MEIKKIVNDELSPEEARAELQAIILRAQLALEKLPVQETDGDAISKYVEDLVIPDELGVDQIDRMELYAFYENGQKRLVATQTEGLTELEPGDRLDMHFDVLITPAPAPENAFQSLIDRAVVPNQWLTTGSPGITTATTSATGYRVQPAPIQNSGITWDQSLNSWTMPAANSYSTVTHAAVYATNSFETMNKRLEELEGKLAAEEIVTMDGSKYQIPKA